MVQKFAIAGGILCLLSTSPTLRSESMAVGVEQLRQDALQEAFRVLKQNYIRADELNHDAINRAALSGLLDRLEIGAQLASDTTIEGSDKTSTIAYPNLLVPLTDELAYFRLGLDSDLPSVEDLDSLCNGAQRLILDLRTPDQSNDFARAAQFLDTFIPAGELIFQIKKPDGGRGTVYQAQSGTVQLPPIVLLIDEQTSPAAEVIAAVLARRDDVLVAGTKSLGRTVRYANVPIAEGVRLRYAEAEVHLPGGERPYGAGVQPSISLPSDLGNKQQAMAAADPDNTEGFISSLHDRERPRLNEAALVAGTNPELPGLVDRARRRQLAAEGKGDPTDSELGPPVAVDIVLRQVLDFLTAAASLDISIEKQPSPDDNQSP